MKFMIDAQLPRRLVLQLRQSGFEAQHTRGLEAGNRTSDTQIAAIADREKAIVVTKDADFLNAHILKKWPEKLLIISTGNISNKALLYLFECHIDAISSALQPRLCDRMRSVLRNRGAKERITIRDCSPDGQRCALLA